MMFVTLSEIENTEVVESDEGKLHWVEIGKIDSLKIFEDVKIIWDKIRELREDEIFTAKSRF